MNYRSHAKEEVIEALKQGKEELPRSKRQPARMCRGQKEEKGMRKRDLQTQRAVQEIISQISYPATCTGKRLAESKEDIIREHGTVSLDGQELFNLKYEVSRYWPEFDSNNYDVLAEDIKYVAECLLERSIKRETYKGKPLFDVLLYYQGDLEYHGRTGLAYKVLD